MIAIIDYGAGNIRSIEKALEYVGAQVQVTSDPAVVANAHAIVLPGVGSGGAAMSCMSQDCYDGVGQPLASTENHSAQHCVHGLKQHLSEFLPG